METAYLRPRDPYSPPGPGAAGPLGGPGAVGAMKHATFPRSAKAERADREQPSCDCCPYGYHIDLDFVRFCERLAGHKSPQTASKARRRERRRQRQSMDVLLGLVAPPDQPQVWTIEQTMPQMPPSPVSLPPHASILVRDALQRAVLDFEETLERSSPTASLFHPAPPPVSLLSAPAPPPVPPRIPPRRYQQTESVSTKTQVNARYLEQALDSGLWAAAPTAGPAGPALQNIRQQMARSLERMRELEEEVKMIPVLQVQLSVLQEEKRKMLLNMKNTQQPLIKQNGFSHLDVLKIEEPARSDAAKRRSAPAAAPGGPSAGAPGRGAGGAVTRDIGVGCTVLTREVGVTSPLPRLRSVGTCTESPRLALSSVWTQQIQSEPPRTDCRGVQTEQHRVSSRSSQTDPPPPAPPPPEPLPPPPRPATREAGVQVQPPSVHKTHVGVSVRTPLADAAVSCVPKTRDAASSDHTLDDVLCVKCSARKRSVAVETDPARSEDGAAKRVCLDALGAAPAPAPAPPAPPPPPKPRTRTVGCGTVAAQPVTTINRAVNTEPPVTAALVSRAVNTDAAPRPPTTVSRATHADVRTPRSSRSTNTDAPVPVVRKDAATATVRPRLVDAAVTCSVGLETRPSTLAVSPAQSRIPRLHAVSLSPTAPAAPAAPAATPPPRQFKRQDTYTKEPAPVVDITNKSPPPRRQAETANRKSETARRQEADSEDEERENTRPDSGDHYHPVRSENTRPDSSEHYHPVRSEPREKSEPSKEMRAALKVLDDNLQKRQPLPGGGAAGTVPQELRNAFSIVQLEWFKVSSTKSADPLEVEDYLDYFEDKSTRLLEYVINMTDNSGNTAMHYAVSHGNFDVVSVLLDSKVCNVDVMNTAGYTSVMLVSLAQIRTETHRHVVRRLFHLADVNTRAKQHGQTALMLAVSHGRLDTVRLLLEAGADVNIQDEDGSTALMCAAEHGHLDIIKLLLGQPDCDVTVVDHDGSTALSIAMEAGHRDIGVLLYAQEHFSRGSSPYNSLRGRRARSVTPTGAAGRPASTPPPQRRSIPASATPSATPNPTPAAGPALKGKP